MMKILFMTKTTAGALWIIPQILEARGRGHEVLVVTPSNDGPLKTALAQAAAVDPGIVHQQIAFDFRYRNPFKVIAAMRRFRKLVQHENVDVIFSHLYAAVLFSRFATMGTGVHRVTSVPGPLYLESRLVRWFERMFVGLDSAVVAGSAYTARLYSQLAGRRVPIFTVFYGADLDRFRNEYPGGKSVARAQLGIPDAQFVVVMVAYVYPPKRLVYRGEGIKGHNYLLESWRTFVKQNPNSTLVLVGGGHGENGKIHRESILKLNEDQIASQHLIWLDTTEDVRQAYAAADVSISPSLSENHGAAVEASAMGVPSIVSDAGGLPETVTAESGWVFQAGSQADLLARLELAHARWKEGALPSMGQCARAHCEKNWDVQLQAPKAIDVLEHILQNN